MKKTLLTLTLSCISLLAGAQTVSKVTEINAYLEFTAQFTTNNKLVIYTREIVNGTDCKFTVFNDNMSIDRTFVITNCVEEGGYYDFFNLATLDIETGYDTNSSRISQTLFNNDDKFEVLKPVYKSNGSGKVIEKFQVINEDNAVLGEIPVTNGEYDSSDIWLTVFALGENNFIVFGEDDNDSVTYVVYKINKGSGDKVSMTKAPLAFAYPNPVRANQTLTIQLSSDANLSTGSSYVEIINVAGAVVRRQAIEAVESQVKVSVSRLATGQYIYNIVSEGEIIESGKVIVK